MAKKILIADDEMEMRSLIRMSLTEYDLSIIEAKDGKSCLEKTKELKPDLVIMDHSMPIMNGYEALKLIKQSEDTSRIPVIMLTKARFDEEMKGLIKLEAVEFLEKPFTQDELIKAIVKNIGELPRLFQPTVSSPKPVATTESVSEKDGSEKIKILIADDSPEIRTLLRIMLKDRYEVIEVKDGAKLIDETLKNSPSLIIADIMMPGLDGFRAVGRLRKSSSFSMTPVIFISAAISDRDQYLKLKPEGPSCFMTKPIKSKELLAKIDELLKIGE